MLPPRVRSLLYSHERFLAGDQAAVSADFRGLNLSHMDFRKRDMRRANLSRVNLEGADLRGVDLSGANLSGANLHTVKLKGAKFNGADQCRSVWGQDGWGDLG